MTVVPIIFQVIWSHLKPYYRNERLHKRNYANNNSFIVYSTENLCGLAVTPSRHYCLADANTMAAEDDADGTLR